MGACGVPSDERVESLEPEPEDELALTVVGADHGSGGVIVCRQLRLREGVHRASFRLLRCAATMHPA